MTVLNTAAGLYVGSQPAEAAYLGATRVWSSRWRYFQGWEDGTVAGWTTPLTWVALSAHAGPFPPGMTPVSGSWVLQLSNTGVAASGQPQMLHAGIPVPTTLVGRTFRFAFWVRHSSPFGVNCNVQAWWQPGQLSLSQGPYSAASSSAWQERAVTSVMPAGASAVDFRFNSNTSHSGTLGWLIFLDDASIEVL